MATNGETAKHVTAVIGNSKNFWLFDSSEGFDLTHPSKPDAHTTGPRVTIATETSPITVDPAKSALVIIDMQNYFLSSALGRTRGAGHEALDQLVEHAIPACREAGIRVIWLNWGLSQEDVDDMPPSVCRAFGFEAKVGEELVAVDKYGNAGFTGGDKLFEDGKGGRKYSGPGCPMGLVKSDSGEETDAGRLLIRDQWNSALAPPLDRLYQEGKEIESRPDVWIHKNRMSGMWNSENPCEEFLEKEGIKSLFFTGVNTDQCVGGTYQDAFSKGYDCILLNDGCGTTSPSYSQQMMEFNATNTWGFSTSCKELAEGVKRMQK